MKVLQTSDAQAWRITLNAPPLHILDIPMLEELRDALSTVRDDRHALIIDATGTRAFSAGVSIHDHLGDRIGLMLERFHECFRVLDRLEILTIALVRGMALGGGCELALACDFVLASERASFGYPEINLGAFPPVGALQMSTQTAPRLGLELLATGEPIDAAGARNLGLVNAVLPPDTFDRDAAVWMNRIFCKSSSSLRFTKRAFRNGGQGHFSESLARVERIYLDELTRTADANEGLEAFIEKRQPRWKHS